MQQESEQSIFGRTQSDNQTPNDSQVWSFIKKQKESSFGQVRQLV